MNYTLKYVPTGEIREPREGEFFKGDRGNIVQAMFDFRATFFPIMKEIVEPSGEHTEQALSDTEGK